MIMSQFRRHLDQGNQVRQTHRVPLADLVLPIVREGRGQVALRRVAETGNHLHATALERTLGWMAIANGRDARRI